MWGRKRGQAKPAIQVVNNRVVVSPSSATNDVTIARLTARADLILDELDGVIKQLATMLKESISDD